MNQRGTSSRDRLKESDRDVSSTSVTGTALLASVFDAIPTIVVILDAETGSFEHVSERFVAYTGHKPSGTRGMDWRAFVHPIDLARARKALAGQVANGESFRTEVRLLDRHGSYRWHDVRASPVKRPTGEVERWFGTCTDIDDLRRSDRERALAVAVLHAISAARQPDEVLGRFAEALTEELVDFCAVDLDEVGSLVPRRAALSVAGSAAAIPEVLRQTLTREERDAITRSKERLELERRPAPLSSSATLVLPLLVDGEPCGHVWLATFGPAHALDGCDRRTAEELVEQLGLALQRARQLDDAVHTARVGDELLRLASHDLKTPLSTVLGWSRLLREDRSDPARVARGLAVIERGASQMNRKLDELLDASRVVSGQARLDLRAASIAAIAREAAEALRPVADEKRITVRLSLDEAALAWVDPGRIRTSLDQLLANAASFTPHGGSISIAVRCMNEAAGRSHVEVEVQDSGVGIDPSRLASIFDRFRKGHREDSARSGFGIGLAIVRAVAELHGGSVRAKSDGTGTGATLTMRLPVRSPTSVVAPDVGPTSARAAARSNDLNGVRILVVDDEADARELCSTVLALHGAIVRTAESAGDAMRALSESPADVLLSDIGMPNEDGVSLVRKAKDAFPRLRAIAASAYTRAEDQERALRAGFDHYLTKPVDPDALATTVAALARAPR